MGKLTVKRLGSVAGKLLRMVEGISYPKVMEAGIFILCPPSVIVKGGSWV